MKLDFDDFDDCADRRGLDYKRVAWDLQDLDGILFTAVAHLDPADARMLAAFENAQRFVIRIPNSLATFKSVWEPD